MAQKNFADALNQIVNGGNGLQSRIDTKAPIVSPNLTGKPTAPTADNNTDNNQIATTEFVQNLIRRLVGAAPSTLDTLVELATAINNDPKIAETITQALDKKLDKTTASSTYLTKSDASSTYLTKTGTAASATKAWLDGNGNTISTTYATKSDLSGINMSNKLDKSTFESYFVPGKNACMVKNGELVSEQSDDERWYIGPDSSGLHIVSARKHYYFKSDGIYLGGTKITN